MAVQASALVPFRRMREVVGGREIVGAAQLDPHRQTPAAWEPQMWRESNFRRNSQSKEALGFNPDGKLPLNNARAFFRNLRDLS